MHSGLLARPLQLAPLSGAASPPAALPCRRAPWGLGVLTATLRRPCRRNPCGAAKTERPDRRGFRFAAAGQLSSSSPPQHVRPPPPLYLVS